MLYHQIAIGDSETSSLPYLRFSKKSLKMNPKLHGVTIPNIIFDGKKPIQYPSRLCGLGAAHAAGGSCVRPSSSLGWIWMPMTSTGPSWTSSGGRSFFVILHFRPTCKGRNVMRLAVFDDMFVMFVWTSRNMLSFGSSVCAMATACPVGCDLLDTRVKIQCHRQSCSSKRWF